MTDGNSEQGPTYNKRTILGGLVAAAATAFGFNRTSSGRGEAIKTLNPLPPDASPIQNPYDLPYNSQDGKPVDLSTAKNGTLAETGAPTPPGPELTPAPDQKAATTATPSPYDAPYSLSNPNPNKTS